MYEASGGKISYHGGDGAQNLDVGELGKEALGQYREKVRYVFQDPARSLNPRMNVYEVLVSGCRRQMARNGIGEKELRIKAEAILEEAGLRGEDLQRRPQEFSGGQRQRISIARGLLVEPELLICDEVVSALDLSIQAQILNLLLEIREKRDISFLFIAHDLKVACYFCDRIGVMYRGELMEEAPAKDLFREGRHPYTKLLFSSVTGANGITGEGGTPPPPLQPPAGSGRLPLPPSPRDISSGTEESPCCAFAGRCPRAAERCFREHPLLRKNGEGHLLRCFFD